VQQKAHLLVVLSSICEDGRWLAGRIAEGVYGGGDARVFSLPGIVLPNNESALSGCGRAGASLGGEREEPEESGGGEGEQHAGVY